MALRGTLKDFGIADILQLLGHQGKSGVLTVKNGDQAAQIFFADGGVVRAELSSRAKRELLGNMLTRAEVVSEEQLSRALETHKRSGKRIGQVLVESGIIDRKALGAFARLQTTETIYRLFVWSTGTYEFIQKEVASEAEIDPIRTEMLLMEGFRQLDEWPGIRRVITGYSVAFERIEDLDTLLASAPPPDEAALENDFGDFELGGETPKSARLRNIGKNERAIYQLLAPGRDVQKLIDLSRLGEFETCKALFNLVEASIVRATEAQTKRASSPDSAIGAINERKGRALWPTVWRVALAGAVAIVVVLALLRLAESNYIVAPWQRAPWGFVDTSLQSELGVGQMQRLMHALALHKARTGGYPDELQALVESRLLVMDDLSFPWNSDYHYERRGDSYVIVRPLY